MPVETCQGVREDSSGRKNNYLQNYWIVVVIISLSQSTIYKRCLTLVSMETWNFHIREITLLLHRGLNFSVV